MVLLDGGLKPINETLCFLQILNPARNGLLGDSENRPGGMFNNDSKKFRELIEKYVIFYK